MNTLRTIIFITLMMTGYVMQSQTPCVGGMAAGYPCNNVDLYSMVPLSAMGSTGANDIWGWTNPATGNEFVLLGLIEGTAFFNIDDPLNPVYLGMLPTQTSNSTWRDIKTYKNHAYIVSEAGGHGIQVFDLTQLENVATPPQIFTALSTFDGIGVGGAHNIVINECSGYAYAVGANDCGSGLLAVDISNPAALTFAGCFSLDGYTHDAQCIDYIGPDSDYIGAEICLNSNTNTLTIVDVTDKTDMTQISRTGYAGVRYTHQGWTTENQEYFLMNDEIDEGGNGHNTRTHLWDIRDLDAPIYLGYYESANASTDHNLYVKGNYAYLSNYSSGLRIYDVSTVSPTAISEVAYFDVYPSDNNVGYIGSWSNYPYFPSGIIAVTNRSEGLFLVKYDPCGDGTQNCTGTNLICGASTCTPCNIACAAVDLNINFDGSPNQTSWDILDANGNVVSSGGNYNGLAANSSTLENACLPDGCYTIRFYDSVSNGMCPFQSTASSSGTFITPGTLIASGSVVATLGTVITPGICGNYTLTDADGTTLASGGAGFGALQTRNFCLSGGLAPRIDGDISTPYDTPDTEVSIIPTLVNHTLTVNYLLEETNDVQLSILDLTGQIIQQNKITALEGMQQTQLDVSALTPGYYFLQFINNGVITARKFIKH